MGAAALPLTLLSTGLGAASSLARASGDAQAAGAQAGADEYRAGQADLSAKIGQVQATQTDQYMRQGLASTLANISAIRSAAGTATDSPTGAAIAARVTGQSDMERQQREANLQEQIISDQGASAFYRQSASNALSGGSTGVMGDLIGGLGNFAGGLGGAFKSMKI